MMASNNNIGVNPIADALIKIATALDNVAEQIANVSTSLDNIESKTNNKINIFIITRAFSFFSRYKQKTRY